MLDLHGAVHEVGVVCRGSRAARSGRAARCALDVQLQPRIRGRRLRRLRGDEHELHAARRSRCPAARAIARAIGRESLVQQAQSARPASGSRLAACGRRCAQRAHGDASPTARAAGKLRRKHAVDERIARIALQSAAASRRGDMRQVVRSARGVNRTRSSGRRFAYFQFSSRAVGRPRDGERLDGAAATLGADARQAGSASRPLHAPARCDLRERCAHRQAASPVTQS